MSNKRIALVTGGSRGLGRSAALHLARKGVDVVITYRAQKDEADRVVREVQAGGGRTVALRARYGGHGQASPASPKSCAGRSTRLGAGRASTTSSTTPARWSTRASRRRRRTTSTP